MTVSSLHETDWSKWIGKTEQTSDTIDARQMRLMLAMLDRSAEVKDGVALPPLWHWIYFHTTARQSTLAKDGHPERGDFLPAVPLPHRMWAGGKLDFNTPLCIGETVDKTSTIKDVRLKKGRSGDLCFVTVRHALSVEDDIRLTEDHDIVYRGNTPPGTVKPSPETAPENPDWHEIVEPDPVLLFRYSALTFNSHRIHYDKPYCIEEEGYPGLVFHGPLTSTLLLDLALRNNPEKRITKYEYRALAPLFDTAPFTIAGRKKAEGCEVWAATPDGHLAMKGSVTFA